MNEHKFNEWNVCEKCLKGMEEYESYKEATESECKPTLYKLVSNCCSAPVYEETDICSACGEHCDLVETE